MVKLTKINKESNKFKQGKTCVLLGLKVATVYVKLTLEARKNLFYLYWITDRREVCWSGWDVSNMGETCAEHKENRTKQDWQQPTVFAYLHKICLVSHKWNNDYENAHDIPQ